MTEDSALKVKAKENDTGLRRTTQTSLQVDVERVTRLQLLLDRPSTADGETAATFCRRFETRI